MRFADLLTISFRNFLNRKSRFLFTIAGVSVGIGAVLFLVSLGFGLQNMLLQRITTQESLLTLDISSPDPEIITINQANLASIEEMENVEKASPHAVLPGQVNLGEITSEAVINLVEKDFFFLAGITPSQGKTLAEAGKNSAVVNESVAKLFNQEPEQLLGKEFSFTVFLPKQGEEVQGEIEIYEIKQNFKVAGVISNQTTSAQVYLNLQDISDFPLTSYQFAKVKVDKGGNMQKVREALISRGFMVSALSDTINQANRIFFAIQIILAIFGSIALIVAAIGLVNTMTISLLERTNEIGILRAIGGSKADIRNLFLAESVLTGILGGIGGILFGVVGGEIFNFGINFLAGALGGEPVRIFIYPVWFIIFILALSALVGLIGGVFPARRASKLDPLQALRYK